MQFRFSVSPSSAPLSCFWRDLLGNKPKPHRNGNGNGHGPGTFDVPMRRRRNGNGNGNGNGHVYGNGEKKNGNSQFGGLSEVAIPQLVQLSDVDGVGVGGKLENWFARLLHECGAPFSRDVAFMTEIAGGLLVGGVIFVWFESVPLAALGFFIGMGLVIGMYVLARNRRQTIMREQLPDAIEHLARAAAPGKRLTKR